MINDLSELNTSARINLRSTKESQDKLITASEDRKRFEVDLRKKKRLVAFQCFRENTKFHVNEEFRRFIHEKKQNWVPFVIIHFGIFIQSILTRSADIKNRFFNGAEGGFEEFINYLSICQEISTVFWNLTLYEQSELLKIISELSELQYELAYITRISDLKTIISNVLNTSELKFKDFTFLSSFFARVIEIEDLNFAGKLNVLHIVNEKLQTEKKIANGEIVFMSKVMKNEEKLIVKYYENFYLCANINQFTSNKLSGDHFSLILCSIVSVDVNELHKYYGIFVLDYFAIIMRRSSDTANLNSLIGLRRLAQNNGKTAFYIVIHEVLLLIFDRLKHDSEELSNEAAFVVLGIVRKNYKRSVEELIRRGVVQEFAIKIGSGRFSVGFFDVALQIFEDVAEEVKKKVSGDVREHLVNVLFEALGGLDGKYEDRVNQVIQLISV